MTSGFVWTVIGSVAGVVAVIVALIIGLRQTRADKNDHSSGGVNQSVTSGRDAYSAGRDQSVHFEVDADDKWKSS